MAAPSIDGVFVLQRGFVYFDNVTSSFADNALRKATPNGKWVVGDVEAGALFLLFLFIQLAVSNFDGRFFDPGPYVAGFEIERIDLFE